VWTCRSGSGNADFAAWLACGLPRGRMAHSFDYLGCCCRTTVPPHHIRSGAVVTTGLGFTSLRWAPRVSFFLLCVVCIEPWRFYAPPLCSVLAWLKCIFFFCVFRFPLDGMCSGSLVNLDYYITVISVFSLSDALIRSGCFFGQISLFNFGWIVSRYEQFFTHLWSSWMWRVNLGTIGVSRTCKNVLYICTLGCLSMMHSLFFWLYCCALHFNPFWQLS
jgi:hypothetical protein